MRLPISQVIKRLRKEKNITQEELATALNVTYQSVSRWETDQAYPDIELLPLIANYFEISTDVLLGTDEISNECKRQEFLKLIEKQGNVYCDEDFKIYEKTLQDAIKSFPRDVFFQWKLCSLYWQMGIECAKKNLDVLRKLSLFVIENDKSKYRDYRNRCIKIMIRVEDDDKLDDWTKYASVTFYDSLPSLITSRFDYRNEVRWYNEQIQENIIESLQDMFYRDFCKRDEKTYKNAKSRADGQKIILKIIDVLSDSKDEIDGWIEDRAMAYLRLAAGLVGSGEIEDGFEALEKSVDLYIKIWNIPSGTVLKFNSPALDLTTRTIDDDFRKINIQILQSVLNNSKGWEWFNSIRKTDRFKTLVEKVNNLI